MSRIELAHPYLDAIEPYTPPDLEAIAARAGVAVQDLIRLNANEYPLGPLPSAVEAMAAYDAYGFYPDYDPLREALARYAGVAPEQVVLGNGADELIDLLMRPLVEPGQAVVTCPPTFSMYRFYARVNRCRVLPVPCREDFSVDVEAIAAAVRKSEHEPRLLFLVSPGNPGGQAIPLPVIERLLALPLLVAVDEAYIEFGGESAVPLLAAHENLAVIRTFSKWAGMAGLRLGYLLLTPQLAAQLERIRAPYNVNAAVLAAALATLEHLEEAQTRVAQVIAERERLRETLSTLPGLEPLPSQTNFVLCRVEGRRPEAIIEGLEQRGILIRGFSSPRMEDYIRISVGTPEQNDALLAALREIG